MATSNPEQQHAGAATSASRGTSMREPAPTFELKRRRWPGLLAAGAIGLAVAAMAILSWQAPATNPSAASAPRDAGGSTMAAESRDSKILARIDQSIKADPSLAALAVEFRVDAGVVTLVGDAPDEATRARLAAIASTPAGVRSVENHVVAGTP